MSNHAEICVYLSNNKSAIRLVLVNISMSCCGHSYFVHPNFNFHRGIKHVDVSNF